MKTEIGQGLKTSLLLRPVVLLCGLTLGAAGAVAQTEETREAIVLDAAQRTHVLAEMRSMLASVQGIVAALADEDMAAVARAARNSGMGMARTNPPGLGARLPAQFRQWGGGVHRGFDELAIAAEQGESSDMLLMRLGEQMETCVACHSTYHISRQQPDS